MNKACRKLHRIIGKEVLKARRESDYETFREVSCYAFRHFMQDEKIEVMVG